MQKEYARTLQLHLRAKPEAWALQEEERYKLKAQEIYQQNNNRKLTKTQGREPNSGVGIL
jgi:hypothetical protein